MTIDEPIEENDVRELLKTVLVKENLQNVDIEFQHGSNVGDGYLGVTKAIQVKSGDKILKLFIKVAPKDKKLREVLISHKIFLKEIYFYDQIIATYDEFLLKRTGKSLGITAKCYATNSEDSKEALAFENLKELGFRLFDKKQLLDEEHVLLSLRSYAKLHGVSYALKDQNPDVFRSLTVNITESQIDLLKLLDYDNVVVNSAETIRNHLEGKVDPVYLDKLDGVAGKLYDILEESVAFEGTHKIITQGDSWVNNVLYKYEEGSNKPIEIKLLDFQMNRVSLPVFDLSYFFYCSAGSKENLEKLDYYLEYYHQNLISFLSDLGSDGNKIYPYDTFKEHWKKFSRFGLLLSLGVVKMVMSESEETPNLAKMMSSGENQKDAFDIKLSNEEAYVDRIKPILFHFVNNNFW